MFFLLRMAFWLTVIFALVPMFAGHDERPVQTAATNLSAGDAFSAATETVSDLSQFCSRRPEACAIGAEAVAAVGSRAQTGMKILLGYLQEKTAGVDSAHGGAAHSRKAEPEKNVNNRSAGAKPSAATSDRMSRDTLLPADLGPAWRGSRPDRDGGNPA